MIILLDQSTSKIYERKIQYPAVKFGQFRTPLTQYKSGCFNYILDNGCFSEFKEKTFTNMALKAKNDIFCDFIVLPDTVGDATLTFNQFYHWKKQLNLKSNKCGFVLQDGVSDNNFPSWDDFGCLFIGGSTDFKMSSLAYQYAKKAIEKGKHVHVGRVNTVDRIVKWFNNCHSIDGSGISKYDHMLEKAVHTLIECNKFQQKNLFEFTKEAKL